MIHIAKKDLKNLTVEVNEDGGFTVWVTERQKIRGRIKTFKHWIIDGSCIKEDGEIRLGGNVGWKVNAKFDDKANAIYVTRSKFKNK